MFRSYVLRFFLYHDCILNRQDFGITVLVACALMQFVVFYNRFLPLKKERMKTG